MKRFVISGLAAVIAATVLVASSDGPALSPEAEYELNQPIPADPAIACQTPVAEAFDLIRLQALELSELASAIPAPLEDPADPGATPLRADETETLAELGSRARELDAMTMQAFSPSAPLSPRERLLAQGAAAHTARLVNLSARLEATDVVDGEFDAAALVNTLDAVSTQGWELAELISDAVLCDDAFSMNRAPSHAPTPSCETFEPEYELAMHNACSY